MNIIAWIILVTLIGDLILNFTGDLLNLNKIDEKVPAEFEEYYDSERYRQSQAYLKTNTYFGWAAGAFDFLVILVVWFSGGFQLLDAWARSFGYGPVVTGLLYIGALILAKSLLSLPFIVYSTFVIEERFGFNKTTIPTFIADIVKGTILGIIIGAPVLSALIAFFEYAGDNAWWYCWIGVTLYSICIQFIAPVWILPLFNKFDPLDDEELKSAIFSYSRSVDFPLKNVFIMDGSKRSGKSNAFFTGFGKNRRIALFDTLVEKHTIPELVAILAHEIGHYKKKHILKAMIIGVLQTGAMLFLLSIFISYQGLFDAFFVEKKSIYAGMIFFGMLFSPIDFFLGLIMQAYSRKNEYEADAFAVNTTNDAKPFIRALKKLSVHNLSNLSPHPFYVFLNYSHPPVMDRIQSVRQITQPPSVYGSMPDQTQQTSRLPSIREKNSAGTLS